VNDAGQPRGKASEELGRLLAELLDELAGSGGLDDLSGLAGRGGLAGLGGLDGLAGLGGLDGLAGLGGLDGLAGLGGLRGHAGHAGLDAPECRICPVCRAVAMLRQTRPEVLEHLVAAAGELAAAVRLVVTPPDATPAEEPAAGEAEAATEAEESAAGEGRPQDAVRRGGARSGREPAPIERIDVTD
jgi:hypothetical protein